MTCDVHSGDEGSADTPTLVTDGGARGGYHRQLYPVIFRHLSAIVTSFSLSDFYLLIYLTDIAGGPFGGVLSPPRSPTPHG